MRRTNNDLGMCLMSPCLHKRLGLPAHIYPKGMNLFSPYFLTKEGQFCFAISQKLETPSIVSYETISEASLKCIDNKFF